MLSNIARKSIAGQYEGKEKERWDKSSKKEKKKLNWMLDF